MSEHDHDLAKMPRWGVAWGEFDYKPVYHGADEREIQAVSGYCDPEYRFHWALRIGDTFDGASIPRILWSTVGHPFKREYERAAATHDVYYTSPRGRTREECDLMLYTFSRYMGNGPIRSRLMYWGVRIGGWLTWNKYRRLERGG